MDSEQLIEVIWQGVGESLAEVTAALCRYDDNLACVLGRFDNEAFPLRGYLSVERKGSDTELAITVDVKQTGDTYAVESDICLEDGTLIADGPMIEIPVKDVGGRQKRMIALWLASFRRFVSENHDAIVDATRAP